jgi:hypothetical protein
MPAPAERGIPRIEDPELHVHVQAKVRNRRTPLATRAERLVP